MIIPLGHDKAIFHVPYVTLGIAALCLLIQVYGSFTATDEQRLEQLQQQSYELRERLWDKHGRRWLQEKQLAPVQQPEMGPDLLRQLQQAAEHQRRFFSELDAGRAVPESDPDYLELQTLTREALRGAGLLHLGYKRGAPLYTLITYAFVHGGWFHLVGNMLFLWLCGCNMEDRWGRVVWALLYLGGGAVAALTFVAFQRDDPSPLVGASGAIAAAMGAFLVVNHDARIRLGYFFFYWRIVYGTFTLRALWALPLWLLQQFSGVLSEGNSGGVAYWAHIGGFAFGLAAAAVLKLAGWDRRLVQASEEEGTVFQQDPLYLEGTRALERGDRARAQSSFERLLGRQPDHQDAAIELFRLSLQGEDPAAAAQAAGRAIALCRKQGNEGSLPGMYLDLRERHPQALLDERSLLLVAQALEKHDAREAASTYERLLAAYPEAAMRAKTLLQAARLYCDKLNDLARGRALLEQVRSDYPGSPYAEEAARRLTQPQG